jgi:hypothetical protein
MQPNHHEPASSCRAGEISNTSCPIRDRVTTAGPCICRHGLNHELYITYMCNSPHIIVFFRTAAAPMQDSGTHTHEFVAPASDACTPLCLLLHKGLMRRSCPLPFPWRCSGAQRMLFSMSQSINRGGMDYWKEEPADHRFSVQWHGRP